MAVLVVVVWDRIAVVNSLPCFIGYLGGCGMIGLLEGEGENMRVILIRV